MYRKAGETFFWLNIHWSVSNCRSGPSHREELSLWLNVHQKKTAHSLWGPLTNRSSIALIVSCFGEWLRQILTGLLLLHQDEDDEEVQEESEAMDEEQQELEEMEAVLLEEFPAVEEEEAEDEDTEAGAEERLEMEISQRFEKDDNNLTSMMVRRRCWKGILESNVQVIMPFNS